MQLGSPLEALSRAMAHATYKALKPMRVFRRDFSVRFTPEEHRAMIARTNHTPEHEVWPGRFEAVRPDASQVEVLTMFAQSWGSTALGFGGVGGQAITPAYTVALLGPAGDFAVYFAGRFAYRVASEESTEEQLARFYRALQERSVASVKDAAKLYGAVGEWDPKTEPVEKPETNSPAPARARR